jgi:hypothetical protein
MEKSQQNKLLSKVGGLEAMSADEARALLDEVSEDSIASRAEAEAIIKINRKLDDVFPDWDERYCDLIKSFLLTAEEPVGWIDAHESNWLANQFAPLAGDARRNEFELLISVLPHTEGAQVALIKYTLEALIAQAAHSGRMTRDLVEHLRSILLDTAAPEKPWITKWEAQILLRLNDRISFARNDESWLELYTRAMANHLIATAHPAPENTITALDRKLWLQTDTEAELGGAYILSIQSDDDGTWFERMSPSLTLAALAHERARSIAAEPISPLAEEDNWLVERLGWNNRNITPADRALIGFLDAHAPGFTQGLSLASRPAHSAPEMAFS